MIRVFIADDHAMFREGLKQIIARFADLQVVGEASNGRELLASLPGLAADVLILDISMPGMTIFTVLEGLEQIVPGLPVLILSMHPEEQYAIRMMKAGVSGYLTKESAGEELIKAIRKIHSGGKYISSTLAETLLTFYSGDVSKMPHELLSNREYEVMCLLSSGKTLKEIADILCISDKTVTTYRARILEKTGLKNNAELTRYVLENKLIS
ncbi:MAG: response regulator transcription factor [Ignavibacteriales bacterium]|nr:response regulator transcription factor [Ignavibacteriales bacterium]